MTAVTENPKSGRGTVFLGPVPASSPPRWSGYWDAAPDAPAARLEQAPDFECVARAIEWGRARARHVLIRLDDASGYWWAGRGDPPEGIGAIEGRLDVES